MGERSGDLLAGSGGLGSHLHARYRVPDRQPFLEYHTVAFCAKAMTTGAKVFTNRIVGSKKALRMTSRFEATHRSFALPGRLMRIFRAIVEPFVLAVLDAGQHLLLGCAIAGQLIGD